MKKTYNINISGASFTIDEDAYDMLESYLNTLAQIGGRTGQRETAADIEQRISEIFIERQQRSPLSPIISLADVQEVIGRMGSPEEIMDVEVEAHAGASVPPPLYGAPPVQKRLYRDIDNKMLGGVCSGLAWYLGIDVVWVRLIMVALAFITGSIMVLIYIVFWIVVPPARSPYERMQMMGMNPSVTNVGRVVTGDFSRAPSSEQPGAHPGERPMSMSSMPGTSTAANVGRVIVMIFAVLGLLVAGTLLLALSLAFIGCIIAVCVIPEGVGAGSSVLHTRLILGCVIGGSLVAGVPLFLLFRWLLSVLTGQSYPPLQVTQRLFLVIPWILGVAACITCGIILGHVS